MMLLPSERDENSDKSGSFPQFSELPPELREMIWKLCIPRRSVHLFNDDSLSDLYYYSRVPIGACFQPGPLIGRVCREARAVVVRYGGSEPMGNGDRKTWFSPRYDNICLGSPWPFSNDIDVVKLESDSEPGMLNHCRNPIIPLTVNENCFEFGYPRIQSLLARNPGYPTLISRLQKAERMAEWIVDRMVERKECQVMLRVFSIPMTRQEAGSSRMTGLFGEENCVNIELNSDDTRERSITLIPASGQLRYHRLRLCRRGYLVRYMQDMAYKKEIEKFERRLKTFWLMKNGLVDKDEEILDSTMEKVMVGRLDAEGRAILARLPKLKYVITVQFALDGDGTALPRPTEYIAQFV
ncbi:hypothetical protein GGR57DRAFT_476278 [Xylariaceae sp. FL1272]|nr:hypothetical protein GGR57DRAFT_476278 [Xylariaceae sp. FL1272]